jgi:hypothetical protein
LKKIFILPVLAVLIFALLYTNAYASTQLTGTATTCTGLATCSYTISTNSGSGWAKTTASSISFQLPGELEATYWPAYSTQVISVTGTTYNVTGTFSATDVNTSKIVSGSTNTIITVTKHCGYKGCTTKYTLVSGTITVLETDMLPPPFTAPQNLRATTGDDAIILTWTAPASTGGLPITGYHIYRSTSSGTETYYALRGNVLSFTDTQVTIGVTYFYKVSAVNYYSESPLSNEARSCLC